MTDLPDDWRGFFVARDENGAVTGCYRHPVEGTAEEPLAEDHADVVAFHASIAEVLAGADQAARDRQKLLDAAIARAAADLAADDSADADLKAAAERELTRIALASAGTKTITDGTATLSR